MKCRQFPLKFDWTSCFPSKASGQRAGAGMEGNSGLGTTPNCIRGMYIIIHPFTHWLTQRKYIPIPKHRWRFNFIRFPVPNPTRELRKRNSWLKIDWHRRGHTLKENILLYWSLLNYFILSSFISWSIMKTSKMLRIFLSIYVLLQLILWLATNTKINAHTFFYKKEYFLCKCVGDRGLSIARLWPHFSQLKS